MKITLLPSASGDPGKTPYQYATSYLINDTLAIDAGAIGFHQSPREQAVIRHVFLSHTHIDHVASLPIFLDNVAGLNAAPVELYASAIVQQCLRLDVFNGRLWPNFLALTHDGKPFVNVHTIASGQRVEVDGLGVTAVAVHHVVPTLGFIVEDRDAAVVIASDTGPTEEIWQRATGTPNLKAVFLEATFPDEQTRLADLTLHLTPAQFVREMQKLPAAVPFFAVHLKARFRAEVEQELRAAGRSNLEIAKFGTTYEF